MSEPNGVVDYLRERIGKEADSQAHRAARGIRQWADELKSMTDEAEPGSPVDTAVQEIVDAGERAADYLERRGFAGIAEDFGGLVRKRPVLIVAGAIAVGFVVGRMIRSSRKDTPPPDEP
ncbi:hypothetical protein ACFXJ8_32490 [Nonomuraea sp. NPDC059194]|uniref:hypothetical protein n=1 Tax=Nonomuraea sp. NPDC059194 TaxID=3346764 RepID=UPI00367E9587